MTVQPTIFLNCAGSRTQREVRDVLARQGRPMRAYGRTLDAAAMKAAGVADTRQGGLLDIDALAAAMDGCGTVIHMAPALQDKEVAMGQFAIDAARRAGVDRFVYVSVINPQIDYLMNHRAKLAVEDYLIGSGLNYTIVRPMHYYQNIDVAAAVASGRMALTYSVDRPLGFVDMADVGEIVAKVAIEPGHDHAAYDLASDDHSGVELAAILTDLTGTPIEAFRLPLDQIVAMLAPMLASEPGGVDWTASAIERLFTYYDRFGLRGNANVLSWLLGRKPNGFADYARRCLS
ncbi:SDR family oxidoreductase [Rhizorhabdus histidinilytica]|uniref:SDR family oxidoreductase n=1 Tax=Rhizorhabdus histidinilytica TaxID=439228 RepID=UPI00321F8307